jgi:hypothetical protein
MTRPCAAAALMAAVGSATLLAAAEIRVTPLVVDGRVFASFAAHGRVIPGS